MAEQHKLFTPASALGRPFRAFAGAHKKYGTEWIMLSIGVVIVAAIIIIALFPGVFAPYGPLDQEAGPQLAAPSLEHPMGTDNLRRDVFSRVIFGSRTILGVAFSAALLSMIIGVPIGLLSGYVGGILDRILSLIMDSIYSFPGMILAIAFAAMLGPGVFNVTTAVAVVYIPQYYRLVRGQTLSIKEEVYVEAARALGANQWVILGRYVFPNVIATVAVIFSLNIVDGIMFEAALSYLGLGLPANIPDWGMDLSMGKKYLPSGVWWMVTYPGLAIVILATGFTMLGEALAEILNPKLLEK